MRSFSCLKPRDPFKNWSKELDKKAAVWAQKFDSSFKLLLLGPAGVGKTTVLKQMKIIHFEGFTLEERQQKAKEIRSNLLESVRELVACITASGHRIDWQDPDNQARVDFINGLNMDDQTYDLYATKIYDYSKRILTDKAIESLLEKLDHLAITHRSQYLLSRMDEIRSVNYIPNNDDILQSRRQTSDIQKLEFQVQLPGKLASQHSIEQTFCMFDVGGQRGERRKWIQVFDGISAVMFLIDSSSFDTIDEDTGKNKLRETISLFHEVWSTRFLLNSNFILLFNKQDILKQKIERGHRIEEHFPEFRLYKLSSTGQDRALMSKSGEKLNLFRISSSRNAKFAASRSSTLATSSPGSAGTPAGTRRSHEDKVSAGAASATSPKAPTRHSMYDSLHMDSKGAASDQKASAGSQTPPSAPSSHANYIRARSFIRDKFLQITRQMQPNIEHSSSMERRKMSSPNMSSSVSMSTSGYSANRMGVDQPKRTICYHYTTATDTENIRNLFENLQKMVLKSSIQKEARR